MLYELCNRMNDLREMESKSAVLAERGRVLQGSALFSWQRYELFVECRKTFGLKMREIEC